MNATQALILVLIGLFVGSLTSFVLAGALQQRHAVPKATMTLMQYHYNQARRTAQANACDAEAAARHLQRLRELAQDSSAIFAVIGFGGAGFDRRRDVFVGEIDKGLAEGAQCAPISRALKHIGDACEACHHNVR